MATAALHIPVCKDPRPRLRPISPRTRAILCLAWMTPIAVIPAMAGWISAWLERVTYSGKTVHAMLGWMSRDIGLSYLGAGFVVASVVVYGCVFEMWRWVERARDPRGAAKRALLRVPVIMAINMVSVIGIFWVASVVGSWVANTSP